MFLMSCVASAQQVEFTLDFEEGNLRGWIQTGEAFRHQPTLDDNPSARERGQPSNHQGRFWIGTFEKYQGRRGQTPGDIQGDGPRGVLTSSFFIVPSGTLTFLIGGGSSYQTRVELYSRDPDATGLPFATGNDTETMRRVTWNLTPFVGKRMQIRIVDDSSDPWGHINVDDFRFIPARNEFEPPKISKAKVEDTVISPEAREYELQATVRPRRLQVGESVSITANLSPADDNVEYRFDFGDQSISPWTRQPGITHAYDSPGIFQISVTAGRAGMETARIARSRVEPVLASSGKIRVTVEDSLPDIEVSLQPNREDVFVDDEIIFRLVTNRPLDNARYQFYFGDSQSSDGIPVGQTSHSYGAEGLFRAFGSVTVAGRTFRSEPVQIRVRERPEPPRALSLHASPDSAATGKTVHFTARIEPPNRETEYSFFFGDGVQTEWSRHYTAQHTYRQPEIYNAYVMARVGQDQIVESAPVGISIISPPGNGGRFRVILIVFAAIAAAGVGYFLLRPIKIPKIIPHADPGAQSIDSEQTLDLKHEIQVRLFPDRGSQTIEGNSVSLDESVKKEGV